MSVYLLTTFDMRAKRSSELSRLVSSICKQDAAQDVIRPYLLIQNCSTEERETFAATLPAAWNVLFLPNRISLSIARNMIISFLLESVRLENSDIIGFPDDDCWLPSTFISSIVTVFNSISDIGLLICRVSLQPKTIRFDASHVRDAKAIEVVRLTTSNSMFIRGSLINQIGRFDIDLGLGTPAGGGEDTDYAVRAYLVSTYTGFIDQYLIGHREQDEVSAAKYYHGSLQVLARHARQKPALMREFYRKFAVGAYFVLRGRIGYVDYIKYSIQGFKAFLQRRVK